MSHPRTEPIDPTPQWMAETGFIADRQCGYINVVGGIVTACRAAATEEVNVYDEYAEAEVLRWVCPHHFDHGDHTIRKEDD